MDAVLRHLDRATDPVFKDVVMFTDIPSPSIVQNGIQEERLHQADFRVRDFQSLNIDAFKEVDGYDKAVASVRRDYPDASERTLHNEVIAKLFRDDSANILGITEKQAANIESAYRQQLLDAGVTPNDIAFAFSNVSKSSERFANENTNISPSSRSRTRWTNEPRTKEKTQIDVGDTKTVRGTDSQRGVAPTQKRESRQSTVRQKGVHRATDRRIASSRPAQDEDFGQPSNYTFNESDYRPTVVDWARQRFSDKLAPNGKPVWQNFVRWFGSSAVVNEKGEPLEIYRGDRWNEQRYSAEMYT